MATVADDALNAQAVNRMLGAGADVAQAFQQTILRMNNDYSQIAVSAARTHETTTQLLTYNGAMELSGNALMLSAGVLNANTVKGEPRPAPYGPYGASQAGPPVIMVNPSNGTATKV